MQIAWSKTNYPHSLISSGRRPTFASRYVHVCFGWKIPVSFDGRNQEIVIKRANTLLIIVSKSSACCAKKNQPTSQWPTTYSFIKVYCRAEVSIHVFLPILHPFMMIFSTEDSGSHRTGMFLSQVMKYQMGLQSTDLLLSDTLFIEQVMYQKQNTERVCLQNFIVDERYRIWCVCSWSVAIVTSDYKKSC